MCVSSDIVLQCFMHKIMKDDMKSNFFVDMRRGKETKHFSPVAVCCLRFICSVQEKTFFFLKY